MAAQADFPFQRGAFWDAWRARPSVCSTVLRRADEIPPLIVTLGNMYAGRGAVYILTKGVAIYPLPKSFQAIERTTLLYIHQRWSIIGFVKAVIAHTVLSKTTFGRSVYAVGGISRRQRLPGIRIRSTRIENVRDHRCLCGVYRCYDGSALGSGHQRVPEKV